ncbi:hypothetical protein LAX92_23190 [Escherichia coli]|uniref:fimbrial protein n=1 Tax=Escherichia coli TaxID=562 RepID=UPI00210620F8|nr:fimbrial protein [Escherichia coli]MCQ1917269.1 hypothetical protein [Escherichia coli]MDD8724748.1 hypothetical protein [Escherichia coli]
MKIKLKLKKISAYSALILGSVFFSTSAKAWVCTFKSGWTPNNIVYLGFPQSIVVKVSDTIGTVLASKNHVMTTTDLQISDCPGPGYWNWYVRNFNITTTPGEITETAIPGIGIRVKAKIYNQIYIGPGHGISNPTPTGGWLSANDYISVEVVKTAEKVGSGVLNYSYWSDFGQYHDKQYNPGLVLKNSTPVNITGASCEIVGNANKEIKFGTILNKNLASITSQVVPGTEREIIIDLKCNPGTKVAVTYDSINKDPVYKSSITNQGTARGVYIYFPDIGELGQKNTVITSSGESETIKQKVNLYRAGNFSSGSISAQATYTLNYE